MRWANLAAAGVVMTFEQYLGLTVEQREALVTQLNGGE